MHFRFKKTLCFTVDDNKTLKSEFGIQVIKMLNEEEKSVDEKLFSNHYVSCSPGLSDIFTTFNTNDDMVSIHIESAPSSPKLKSILKKTPNKSQIICSPSSAAIRRTKSQVCRRSLSVRRELRFGPDTKKSPTISLISPRISPKKHSRSFQLKKLFRCNSMSTTKEKLDNFITSTPINFLDDTDFSYAINKKKWQSPMRNNLPLFYGSEKFQCGHCKKTWENNNDLMLHTSNNHKGVRHWLRPQYRCGICAEKFYSNRYLLRHCHLQHTPTTKRRL